MNPYAKLEAFTADLLFTMKKTKHALEKIEKHLEKISKVLDNAGREGW